MALETLILERVLAFIPVLLSLSVHEWAHAFAATTHNATVERRIVFILREDFSHTENRKYHNQSKHPHNRDSHCNESPSDNYLPLP